MYAIGSHDRLTNTIFHPTQRTMSVRYIFGYTTTTNRHMYNYGSFFGCYSLLIKVRIATWCSTVPQSREAFRTSSFISADNERIGSFFKYCSFNNLNCSVDLSIKGLNTESQSPLFSAGITF